MAAEYNHASLHFKDQVTGSTGIVTRKGTGSNESGTDIEQGARSNKSNSNASTTGVPTIPIAVADIVPQSNVTGGSGGQIPLSDTQLQHIIDALGQRGPLTTIPESEENPARAHRKTRVRLLGLLLGVAILCITVVVTLFVTGNLSTAPPQLLPLLPSQEPSSLPMTTPTPTTPPTPTPSLGVALPCGGSCDEGSICLETSDIVPSSCCEECKRFTLTQVDTDDDGAGGNVEATFFIQGRPLFGGELSLPPEARHVFRLQPNSVGNIRPDQSVDLRVFETDAGPPFDPHDDARITVLPGTWYDPQQAPYERETAFGGWRLFYTVEAECCA